MVKQDSREAHLQNSKLLSVFMCFIKTLFPWDSLFPLNHTIGSFRIKSITFRQFLHHPTQIFMEFSTVVCSHNNIKNCKYKSRSNINVDIGH